MAKMKTRRAAAKRFTKTGSGKFKHFKKGKRHLNAKMPRSRMRRLSGSQVLDSSEVKRVRAMLPYL